MAKRTSKFNRCVKQVRRTVKARKGSNKESAAIAICTKSVLHPRGRTLKRYRRGRLTTQRKFRGGDLQQDGANLARKLMFQLGEPIDVSAPEAKGSPVVDDMIQKLQGIRDSKSDVKKMAQSLTRGILGTSDITTELVEKLTKLKETGTFQRAKRFDAKLATLYPMM